MKGPDIVVTSPEYCWCGTATQQGESKIVAVLIGKNLPERDSSRKSVEETLQECEKLDIRLLFFEKATHKWETVSPGKIGKEPYLVNQALSFNYGHYIRPCESEDEQSNYLATIGLAIDGEFVGC